MAFALKLLAVIMTLTIGAEVFELNFPGKIESTVRQGILKVDGLVSNRR